tara:strand:+ start:809 stop:1225 length:417 start_codon:yes stop_codon:yes gene_type:complete
MKKIVLFILIFFITTISTAQDWLTDTNFDKVISGQSGFGDSEDIIVIEFWADFNKQNAFVEWQRVARLDGVRYYRADIAKCPELKAKYKIRMVPTILIFSGGDAFIKFKAKAGLDLKCPVNFEKLSRAIGVVRREDSF